MFPRETFCRILQAWSVSKPNFYFPKISVYKQEEPAGIFTKACGERWLIVLWQGEARSSQLPWQNYVLK
jgi:hypothetical protein